MKRWLDEHDCREHEEHYARCAGCGVWLVRCTECRDFTTPSHALDPCPGVD